MNRFVNELYQNRIGFAQLIIRTLLIHGIKEVNSYFLGSTSLRFIVDQIWFSHFCDLLEIKSTDNIDELVRVWSRYNDKQYSIFHLDHP